MSGRPWTNAEKDLVRTHYKRCPTDWLAKQVGRSVAAVRLQADAMGLVKRRVIPDGLLDFIREGNGRGQLDTEIHAAWIAIHAESRVDRKSICNYRRKLGLQVNPESRLRKRREAYRRQLQTLGVKSLTVLSQRHTRRAAQQAGLPLDLRPLEVRIFEVLRRGGYWTRHEIAGAIGLKKPQRAYFKCRYGSQSALYNLVNRGMVRRTVGRTRKMGGKGNTAYEYWIPLNVLQRLSHRKSKIA